MKSFLEEYEKRKYLAFSILAADFNTPREEIDFLINRYLDYRNLLLKKDSSSYRECPVNTNESVFPPNNLLDIILYLGDPIPHGK